MSILEKLKDLVSALETRGIQEEELKVAEPAADTILDIPPPTPTACESTDPLLKEEKEEEEEIEEFPDYLECTDAESENVRILVREVRELKFKLAEVQIQYERSKSSLIYSLATKNKEILSNLESLRLEYGVPEDGYSVQFPFDSSDKVSFTKD